MNYFISVIKKKEWRIQKKKSCFTPLAWLVPAPHVYSRHQLPIENEIVSRILRERSVGGLLAEYPAITRVLFEFSGKIENRIEAELRIPTSSDSAGWFSSMAAG